MFLFLTLSGILSVYERLLLGAVQFRQGPVQVLFHGLFMFIADGVKLYSKYCVDVLFGVGFVFLLGACSSILFGAVSLVFDLAYYAMFLVI